MTKNKIQIPCQKLISGGQTGVDRAVLDACLNYSFPCGGWCPKNRKAEDGKIAAKYPLKELPEEDYAARTHRNVTDSDGTLILVSEDLTGGTLLTQQFAQKLKKPLRIVRTDTNPSHLIPWLILNNINTLNVAGPRESEWTDAYPRTYRFITELIVKIKSSASAMLP
ncbi:putative molybdenum carrier protein [Draconibacterium sediminis]|uniref:Molybdenum cofactor carrier n=1 Tax=Draconibacterium sediminis TaxID=1544798 RepID=A0A0D8JCQ6_9BACT|nr:putative molybdenum carrier protein [Draconibacterium sediminis]KJF44707.1 hypothetical protein LH29_04445 [Draconibacterium sediminis]